MRTEPVIELIYEKTCPNIDKARAALLAALAQSGRSAHWLEWEQNDPDAPPVARRFGSPTILVNGRDVAGESPSGGLPRCRIYADEDGRIRGAPTVASIVAAMLPKPGAMESLARKISDKLRALSWPGTSSFKHRT